MKDYYVYMLRCADGSFYVGITNNLDRRFAEHQLGIDEHCYTFMRRPIELVHQSSFHNVDDAIAWEKQLKGWSRKKKFALIADDWETIKCYASRAGGKPSLRDAPCGAPQDDKR